MFLSHIHISWSVPDLRPQISLPEAWSWLLGSDLGCNGIVSAELGKGL